MSHFVLIETSIDDIEFDEEFLYRADWPGEDSYWVSATLDEDPDDEDGRVFWRADGALGDLDELPDKLYLVRHVTS